MTVEDPTVDPSKLNPPETAPQSGRQILALIRHPETSVPLWAIVQWAPLRPPRSSGSATDGTNAKFWLWQAPGFTKVVEVIGWLCEVPFNDVVGDHALEGESAWTRHGI